VDKPKLTPRSVYVFHTALCDEGEQAPSKITARHFGISPRHVRRLIEGYRLGKRGAGPPPVRPRSAPGPPQVYAPGALEYSVMLVELRRTAAQIDIIINLLLGR